VTAESSRPAGDGRPVGEGQAPDPVAREIADIIDRAETDVVRVARLARAPAREVLDRELRTIKDDVLRMGSLVEEAIRESIDSLERHDAAAALAVIEGDGRINETQHRISNAIITAIATQSPVARDLRLLMTLDHVGYELERMGDHASSVAKQARKLAGVPPLRRAIPMPQMGDLVARQVHSILRALVEIDEAAARKVAAADDEIDHLYRQIFDDLIDLMRADPGNVDRGTRLLFAAYYTERIGDRVTNIAEDVVFLASGEVADLNA
jgi:phosphate transport system protein